MILIGATLAAFTCDREDTSIAWLYEAEILRREHDVQFFAALELDGRGLEPFTKVIDRLTELDGSYYTYSYDDKRQKVNTGNRINHICMGRNVITDRAVDAQASHILFLDADMQPPVDAIAKLLEMRHPLVGGNVPTYVLKGKTVANFPAEWDVQDHMNTAGFLLVERQVFRRLRWRWDAEDGMTDDPCYWLDAKQFLGIPTYVRHDVIGTHYPRDIVCIEDRFPERDLQVY